MTQTLAEQLIQEDFPAYRHVDPSIDDMIALGMHSVLEYNGLILNDRLRPDRYRITSIDGLGGADIRDVRVPRPVSHGEIPYDAYWGGRTITLTGVMEAGSAFELTHMERDLRAAFGTLVESPLKFNWWDVRDEFSDSVTSNAWWKTVSGPAPITAGNGYLTFASSGIAYYAKRQYVDARLIACVQPTKSTPGGAAGIVAKCYSTEQYLSATLEVNAGEFKLFLRRDVPGKAAETLSSAVVGGTAGGAISGSFWIEMNTIGDVVKVNVYSTNPLTTEAISLLIAPIEINLTNELVGGIAAGIDSENFGYGQEGFAGLMATTNEWIFTDFYAEGIWPGDMISYVRPISAPTIKQAYQTKVDKLEREFQIALRAANPKYVSLPPISAGVSLLTGELQRRFTIVHHGTWVALPIVTLNGTITNPVLTNLATGEFIQLEGKIPSTESITIDSTSHTLVNNKKQNVFNLFSPESNFPAIVPGPNTFVFSGVEANESKVQIKCKHTYI